MIKSVIIAYTLREARIAADSLGFETGSWIYVADTMSGSWSEKVQGFYNANKIEPDIYIVGENPSRDMIDNLKARGFTVRLQPNWNEV